jgi:hypothetical protein
MIAKKNGTVGYGNDDMRARDLIGTESPAGQPGDLKVAGLKLNFEPKLSFMAASHFCNTSSCYS